MSVNNESSNCVAVRDLRIHSGTFEGGIPIGELLHAICFDTLSECRDYLRLTVARGPRKETVIVDELLAGWRELAGRR